MQDFKKLVVWQKSHELVLEVYRMTKIYPEDERFGLTSQTRRAAASIPANIVEGCGRETQPDFRRFLQIALGSANELEYHFMLARDLHFIDTSTHTTVENQLLEVKRMLTGLIRKTKET